MTRLMAQDHYRTSQEAGLWDEHIAPINSLVGDLRAKAPARSNGQAPYVAPSLGGVDATILCLMQEPGEASLPETGSGMLSVENDDPAAEMLGKLLEGAGIDQAETVLWNAFPWHRAEPGSRMSAADEIAGIDPLKRLLRLLPKVRVVYLQGAAARKVWERLEAKHPEATARITAVRANGPASSAAQPAEGSPEQPAERGKGRIGAMAEVRSLAPAPEATNSGPRRETLVRAEDLGPEHLGRFVEVTNGVQTISGPLLKAFQPSTAHRITVTVESAGQRRALGVAPDAWVRIYRGAGLR
ncbi:hypothetical protein [Paeniglutamicibacter cryotolerans]|uniref:Uracil-DNA glycosylase n=1 Tax=Paeniglutamicibacter cryotolerans TaxID=670079 RepID=A0A839QRH4_9MICC|nr:hypothetical protein [Paeniglutamicibacter cryotolerans]MBB2997384.1 hypothetical protein [Paeniglutamicibacter cryotolerans]